MKNEQVKQLRFNLREFSLEISTMAENNELKKKKKKYHEKCMNIFALNFI